jgi:ubiquitin-protein ligase
MSASRAMPETNALQCRLLCDLAEIKKNPSPNVFLYFDDANIQKSCLILTSEEQDPLHLTVVFNHDYPLSAPTVTIQSRVKHPNVLDDYICVSMLTTTEDWTPAYTLKGIIIQLLSFFTSDVLEQAHSNIAVDLAAIRRDTAELKRQAGPNNSPHTYSCATCGFRPGYTPSIENMVNSYDFTLTR